MDNTILSLNAVRISKDNIKEEGNLLHVEGYACHFNRTNENYEIVDEHSFEKFFTMLKQNDRMPYFNYNHETGNIIGGWDSIVADEVGLLCKGHLNLDDSFVKDRIIPHLMNGDLNGLSTEGRYPISSVEERESGLYIGEYQLTGISLVSLPADFQAGIDSYNSVRAEFEERKKKNRELEKVLRYYIG